MLSGAPISVVVTSPAPAPSCFVPAAVPSVTQSGKIELLAAAENSRRPPYETKALDCKFLASTSALLALARITLFPKLGPAAMVALKMTSEPNAVIALKRAPEDPAPRSDTRCTALPPPSANQSCQPSLPSSAVQN